MKRIESNNAAITTAIPELRLMVEAYGSDHEVNILVSVVI